MLVPSLYFGSPVISSEFFLRRNPSLCLLDPEIKFINKQRQRIPLTMGDFQAMDKANFWRELGKRSAFGRGLPERKELADVPMANVFKKLLIDGFILSDSIGYLL